MISVPILTPHDRARQLIAAVASEAGVGVRDIYSRSRRSHVCQTRREAMRAVAARFPKLSMPQIGRLFGREHTTVLYSLGRLSRRKPPEMR